MKLPKIHFRDAPIPRNKLEVIQSSQYPLHQTNGRVIPKWHVMESVAHSVTSYCPPTPTSSQWPQLKLGPHRGSPLLPNTR